MAFWFRELAFWSWKSHGLSLLWPPLLVKACSTPYSSDILSQRRWRLASSCSWQASDSTATHPESTIDPSPEPVGLSSLPEVRCYYLWHPYGLCLTQHSAFLAIVHSSLKPQNDSEAARIPQWQQARSILLRNCQSCRRRRSLPYKIERGSKPLPDGKTTIEGNSDSLLVSILRRLLPHWQRLLL